MPTSAHNSDSVCIFAVYYRNETINPATIKFDTTTYIILKTLFVLYIQYIYAYARAYAYTRIQYK